MGRMKLYEGEEVPHLQPSQSREMVQRLHGGQK